MSSAAVQKQGAPGANQFGRPRLLTHDEILDAAVAMGLENLTMKKLAGELGVGTATLYQYFENRQALTRAAAVHNLSDLPLPEDTGQHWAIFCRDYVNVISTLLAENPSFLQSYQHSDYGFEVHFRLIETFLEAMSARGLEPEAAMELFNMIGMVAFAGAVEMTRQREFDYFDESMAEAAKRQFTRLDEGQFPLTQASLGIFTRDPEEKIDNLFRAAVLSIARKIGQPETDVLTALNA